MAIHFNYEGIPDELVSHPNDPERYHPVLDALIWMSLSVGFRKITESNWEKIGQRILELQQVQGPWLQRFVFDKNRDRNIKQFYVLPSDVQKYIGLSVNVSETTDAEWRKYLYKLIKEQAVRIPRNQEGAVEEINKGTAP